MLFDLIGLGQMCRIPVTKGEGTSGFRSWFNVAHLTYQLTTEALSQIL